MAAVISVLGITVETPGGQVEFLSQFNRIERSIAYEPLWTLDLRHYTVAGVDTGGTIDTLQLCSVTDIDSGRTNVHTL